MEYWIEGISCVNEEWEQAYKSFETKEEEVQKFLKRFKQFQFESFDKNLRVLDLFCGTGSGLEALSILGFSNLKGVDLSPDLLKQCKTKNVELFVGDCRDLKLESGSVDLVTIQGGLHHLPSIKEDLPKTLKEIHRVLSDDGKVFIIEPWLTKMLSILHVLYKSKFLRALWPKFDALATMTHLEYPIYDTWLDSKTFIFEELNKNFITEKANERLAKLSYLGKKRTESNL